MKIYIVVVNFHLGIAPQNYVTSCTPFLDKREAIKYLEDKKSEYPTSWSGDYNHVELFEKEI